MTARAFIAIGSNLGDRLANCRAALGRLATLPGTRLERASPLQETAPAEGAAGGPFLNGVAEVVTALDPRALLRELQAIETALGRAADHPRLAARTMDLDLLLYGEARLEEADLRLPHPALARRRFVLEPLAALAPDLCPPGLGGSVRELLARLPGEPEPVVAEGRP